MGCRIDTLFQKAVKNDLGTAFRQRVQLSQEAAQSIGRTSPVSMFDLGIAIRCS